MLGILFLLPLLYLLNLWIFGYLEKRHAFFSRRLMNQLFGYHLFFGLVYYLYATFNRSDSHRYFETSLTHDGSWFDLFGTSTTFIDFLAYPLISGLGFTYEMAMLFFTWLGYLGFVYAYLFFRENIPVKVRVFKKIDFLILVLFLPNMHFWTASLGKGAPIFLGLMMFAYAITDPRKRMVALILSCFLIYYIRPHVFLFVAAGTVLGYMSGKEKISFGKKLMIYIGMIGTLVLVQDQILAMGGLESSDDLVEDFENFSQDRASELGKSGSGVDMSSYSIPVKLLTFWFRPLFFDAPGILGLIVSAENLVYLFLFFKILKKDFIKFVLGSPVVVKMSLVVFLLSSFAMTFVMSNLGIIMRQKSMVMYFLFFIIYYFVAQKKYDRIIKLRKLRRVREMKRKREESVPAAQV